MKKTFKLLAMLLAMAMLMGALAACGGTKEEVPEEPETPEVVEETAKPGEGMNFVIYSDNSFAPFEYYDETEQAYIGVDMDLLAAIAEDQGFTYDMFNEGFDPAMGAVQSGQADAMIAGMTITDERKETYDFADGYFEDGQIMVVAAGSEITSLEDLEGKEVACKIGTMGTEFAEANAEEYGFTISYYEDSPTMYTAVMNGNQDACFEDRSVVEWAILSEGLELETVGEVIEPREYGFAVKKGENADLIAMFNAGLANIKASGQYDEILAKYGY